MHFFDRERHGGGTSNEASTVLMLFHQEFFGSGQPLAKKVIIIMDMKVNFSSVSKSPSQMYEFIPAPLLSSLSNNQEGDGTDSHFKILVAQNVEKFWIERREEIFNAPDARRQNSLPLACIKRIMKSNEQVKMVSAETPVLFAKACELFIMELTMRAWLHARDKNRRTIQRVDVVEAVRDEDLLSFLTDIVPTQMQLEEPLAPVNHPGENTSLPVPYVLLTVPDVLPTYNRIFPMNMQGMDPSGIAQAGHSVATDPRLAYQMNVHDMNHAFMRNHEMQRGFIFPLPPPSSDEAKTYRGFK
ncbi:Nuclear factor Y isoform 1 [Dorcoceras hygrometricum]|uniref:Nuclear factor Y isoform 1 n=1 Tax=Dorcoceras hygrometricum TaxID=472368 RepID=A0A2Z7AHC9_9LAMI|nr:Nuclear factor Y isoform 1 [Dorcoceras hygrometricum]